MSPPDTGTQETPVREPHQKFEGHTGPVSGVIHLVGRQRIITCSDDGSLRLWDLKNGLQIGKDWRDGESGVNAMALSTDGKIVVSGSNDGAVRLWDIERGKMIDKWTGHSEAVWAVCWSGDGKRVVSCSTDGTTRVWNVQSGDSETLGSTTTLNAEFNNGHATVYSPDQTMIATGGRDIKIWDAKTFELLTTLAVAQRVYGLVWVADGKTLQVISGSHGGGSIITWNTTTWKRIALWPMEHSDCIYAIAIYPNRRILASASDVTARLWNLENGQPIGSPLQHPDSVLCISFSADGELLATGCSDNNAYTWDVTAIVKGASFNDLLLNSDLQDSVGRSVLDVDTTLHPSKLPNNTHRLPQGFFVDTGNRNHALQLDPLDHRVRARSVTASSFLCHSVVPILLVTILHRMARHLHPASSARLLSISLDKIVQAADGVHLKLRFRIRKVNLGT